MQILANYTENHLSSNFEDPWKHLVVKNNLYRWKTFVFDAMFCSLATMGVANSRLLMLPNSCVPSVASEQSSSAEIRQNEGEDAKAELFLREFRCLPCCACCAPEECLLSPHYFTVEMCGGYVCTLSCVKYRFIIRFIVALPVEPWLSVQRCERTFLQFAAYLRELESV